MCPVRTRAVPHVGGSVTVVYIGATVSGVVQKVDHGGLRLTVGTDDGDTITFALNRATGRFMADGRQYGARLLFDV
jgi:hypothetical protein